MSEWQRPGWSNPAAWYVVAGLILLAVSFWIPWASASRTTRIELRADEVAGLLQTALREVTGIDGGDGFDAATGEIVLARAFRLGLARGAYVSDVEFVDPRPAGVLLALRSRHYAFQVTESPPAPNDRTGRGAVPALEVTAWPLRNGGPGHCSFFYPDNAARAYSRNLRQSYAGFDHRPPPGKSHRRQDADRTPANYSSFDDELWLEY